MIWILTQDRERIVACNDIMLNGEVIEEVDFDATLGVYETEERAREIQLEIWRCIKFDTTTRLYYEMPIA